MNWARQANIWPMTFGLACCAIEMITGNQPFDLDRFGAVPPGDSASADLMIVAGTVTFKMASRVRRLYEQMPRSKYVIAMELAPWVADRTSWGYHVVKGN